MQIAAGLPEGFRPVEDSPSVEIDECLLTHMGNPDLSTTDR